MSMQLDRCYALSELLSREERLELTKKLLGDLGEQRMPEEVDQAWLAESLRRFEAIRSGQAPLYDEAEVMQEARRALG